MVNRRRFLEAASVVLPVLCQGCSTPSTESDDIAETPLDANVLRNSLSGLQQEGQPISVDLPLLERLYDLNAEIAMKFPAKWWDSGIGAMGLLLDHRLKNGAYWCTPTTSVSFGGTGGDGAHFSFLMTDNRITDQTPVIVSVPDNFGEPEDANVVLGRNLEEFLRLGLHCGYFSMAQFAFDAQASLKHYARNDWDESWFPSDNHKIVAEYLAKSLRLTRLIYSPEDFSALQSRFKRLLRCKRTG